MESVSPVSFELEDGEYMVARRQRDGIFVTNLRVVCGDEQHILDNISCIHGAFSIASRSGYVDAVERKVRDGKQSLWILISLFVSGGILTAAWFCLWLINKAFKVGPLYSWQLVLIVDGEKKLALEDYRRREVKRLGLAIGYARRLRRRELRMNERDSSKGIEPSSI